MSVLTFNNGTVKPGDIFVSSWGCEQTNVNFYQVISVHGKKTVTVREVRGDFIFSQSMAGKVRPQKNDFISDPIKRQIKTCSDRPFISIEDYENAYQCISDESHYFSMYA